MDENQFSMTDDSRDNGRLVGSFPGSINPSDVSLIPTDKRQSISHSHDSSQNLHSLNRKPLQHPVMYGRSINNDVQSNSGTKCNDCGSFISHSKENCEGRNGNFNISATFNRYKYYSRLTNPNDERMRIPDHILPSSMFYLIPSKPDVKQSSIVTIFAIWNTMMGTSLLSMPWGITQSGFVLGILLIVGLGVLTLYTAYRILKAKDYLDHQTFEFSDVVKHYFGTVGEWTALLFGLLAFLGGMIVYWVLMTNFLYMTGVFIHDKATKAYNDTNTSSSDVICKNAPAIHNLTTVFNTYETVDGETEFSKFWNPTRTTPVYLVIILFPLLNFKSPTFFTKFNCLGTISVFYLFVLLMVKASKWGFHMDFNGTSPSAEPLFRSSFPALTGMLSLAFFLHNAVITILRNNRTPKNNARDLSIGYFLVMMTYLVVGTIFYATFPLPKYCISSNLLDNLGTQDILAVIGRTFLLFQMISVFPLLAYMVRVQILHVTFGQIWPGFTHVVVFNTIVVGFCVLIAMFYPHIGDIIRYSGSLCGLAYIFILPSIVYLIAMYRRQSLRPLSVIFHCFIVILGFANFIAQFLITPSK